MTTPATPTPAPIEWANLIQAGRYLLSTQQAGRLPTHEHIRRAESNAYYAMFHSLAHSNATALIGPPTNPTTAAPWSRIYRGLDHTTARRALQSTARNSPYRPGASPTPSSIYNSSVTRPTMNPTPSSPPSTAPCTSTEPSPRSLASPRSRWTSGCTSPRSHWSGRGSGPTRANKSYNRTHQPGASPTG